MLNRILIVGLFLVTFVQVYATEQQVIIGEIKKSLACQCDCNMTVEACEGSMACQSAEKLTAEADKYIKQGMNKADIFGAFTKKYGESILAAPTKKGFNLTAWILPFAAILFAGLAIVVILKRWVGRQQPKSDFTAANISNKKQTKSPYEDRLDEALRYLD